MYEHAKELARKLDPAVPFQEIADLITRAADFAEAERSEIAGRELQARILEAQRQEQVKRDRLTERDERVIEAKANLKQLPTAALQLLLESPALPDHQAAAARFLIQERAAIAVAKLAKTE